MRKHERKKRKVYIGSMALEAYERVEREALCQEMNTYDVSGIHLNGIKNMHVNSLVCVSV